MTLRGLWERLTRRSAPPPEPADFAPESEDGPLSLPPETLRRMGYGGGHSLSDPMRGNSGAGDAAE